MGIREGVNGGLLITAGDREHSAAGRRYIYPHTIGRMARKLIIQQGDPEGYLGRHDS